MLCWLLVQYFNNASQKTNLLSRFRNNKLLQMRFVIQLSDWGDVFLFFAAGLRPSLLSKSAVKFECGELGIDVGATGSARGVEVRTDRCVDSYNVSPHLPIT
jgi:hypothetical protein